MAATSRQKSGGKAKAKMTKPGTPQPKATNCGSDALDDPSCVTEQDSVEDENAHNDSDVSIGNNKPDPTNSEIADRERKETATKKKDVPSTPVKKKVGHPKFKRQPRRSVPVAPTPSRGSTSSAAMKIDYGAIVSIGVLFAVFRDPSSPKNGVFIGNYMTDIEANTDDMADKTNTTKAAFIVDPSDPTQYKQVLTRSGSRYVQENILLHVSPDPDTVAKKEKRRIFASNHAKVLTAYSKGTFKYPMTYETGNDITTTDLVLADLLTWDDTMKLMKENIFVDQTVETLAASSEVMKDYFGSKWEAAKKYFLEATLPDTGDIELESLD